MNAQNAHEYLPLVQAMANGKQIQHKNEHGEWVDVETIVCVAPQKLRIKPKPRTFGIVRSKSCGSIYNEESWDGSYPDNWERITVQEVLK
jgi:hypothetical protein